jgi:transposase InsO family protein
MSKTRRQFSKEFKLQVIRELEAGKSLAQASREHQVHPNMLRKWRQQMSQMIAQEAAPGQVTQLCKALYLSRATFYRYCKAGEPADPDVAVRDRIQRLALQFPSYGYRRITAQLQRDGMVVNHKRVLRLMREDNLLGLHKRRFVVTTDSAHGLPVYPNLVPTLNVTGINQLWQSDITYVRLHSEFIYLAVVRDGCSRHLDASLTVAALQQALEQRTVVPGLVHHSDRGVQYASQRYTDLLNAHGIQISMSRRGNPYDNALAESFIKTLKYEEVHLNDYESFADAHESIEQFLEDVYNHKRLHSALGYRPPAEFEQVLSTPIPP